MVYTEVCITYVEFLLHLCNKIPELVKALVLFHPMDADLCKRGMEKPQCVMCTV